MHSFLVHLCVVRITLTINLFSVCWQRGFEAQWLSLTFSKAIFLGNGLVAILAGLVANTLVGSFSLGPVAPFDAASCVLAIGMGIIIYTWPENYGDPSEGKTIVSQFQQAASAITSGKDALLSNSTHFWFAVIGCCLLNCLLVPFSLRLVCGWGML